MTVEYGSVRELAARLGKVPLELRRELRPQLRAGAEHILNDMRGRASYSTRIPGAIKTTPLFGSRAGGVKIHVDRNRAPHARPLEGMTARGGSFRHPVFGNREVWVSQPARPFFFPAVQAGRDQLRSNISDAVRASLRKV